MNDTPWPWDLAAATAPLQSPPQTRQDSRLLQEWGPLLPGLPGLLKLRQVHALEHATVWVLSEMAIGAGAPRRRTYDNETLGGLSTERGFYLYGSVSRDRLRRATLQALQRFQAGEWDLAIHPRCGTNATVALALVTGLVLVTHWALPRLPLVQLGGLALAAMAATHLAPNLGTIAQQHLTTAIPFNLHLVDVSETSDWWGRKAHFVRLNWQETQ